MSNDNGRVKTYKNKARNQESVVKPYVPQYQVHGIEPQPFRSAMVPTSTSVVGSATRPLDNPRVRKAGLSQPYAAVIPSPVGRGKGPVPNVGNNMEHTWSSVDGAIVDDLADAIDAGQAMIDNNDYVTNEALGLPPEEMPTLDEVATPQPIKFTMSPGHAQEFEQMARETHEDLLDVVNDLEESAYLLIVEGVPVCSGPLEEIQDQARALVFGEHEMCDGNPVPVDDIIILKRVSVKVGLFLE